MDGRIGIGALAFAALLCASLGAAQTTSDSLALSPPTLDLVTPPLVPGETRLAYLTVFNSGGQEVDVTAAGAEPAGAWITAVPAAFHLGPDGQQKVTLKIDVPHNATKGRYLGRIDFTPAATGGGGNQLLAGASGLLDINVDPTMVHNLAIDAMKVGNVHVGDPLPIEVQARNRGNVQDAYRLEVSVLDVKRTTTHLQTSFDAKPMTAGEARTDSFNASVELAEGQYAYTLTAKQVGSSKVLRTEQGLFQVAAPGAKFKLGAMPLLSVTPVKAEAGQEVRLAALFRNEGVVGVEEARLVATVLRDGTPVATLESPASAVGAQRNATLLASYVPDETGTYLVRGHVLYDGLITEDQEAAFEASAASGLFRFLPGLNLHIPPWLGTPLGLLLLLAGLLGLLGLWRRSARREKKKADEDEPTPGTPAPAWLRARPEELAAPKPAAKRRWGWFLFRRDAVAPPAANPVPAPKPPKPWVQRALAWLRQQPRRLIRRTPPDKPSDSKGSSSEHI